MNKLEQWYVNTTKMQKLIIWSPAIAFLYFAISEWDEAYLGFLFIYSGFLLFLHFGKYKNKDKNNNEE